MLGSHYAHFFLLGVEYFPPFVFDTIMSYIAAGDIIILTINLEKIGLLKHCTHVSSHH